MKFVCWKYEFVLIFEILSTQSKNDIHHRFFQSCINRFYEKFFISESFFILSNIKELIVKFTLFGFSALYTSQILRSIKSDFFINLSNDECDKSFHHLLKNFTWDWNNFMCFITAELLFIMFCDFESFQFEFSGFRSIIQW